MASVIKLQSAKIQNKEDDPEAATHEMKPDPHFNFFLYFSDEVIKTCLSHIFLRLKT